MEQFVVLREFTAFSADSTEFRGAVEATALIGPFDSHEEAAEYAMSFGSGFNKVLPLVNPEDTDIRFRP